MIIIFISFLQSIQESAVGLTHDARLDVPRIFSF